MKRDVFDSLKGWVGRTVRKPLVVRGAKQVGESYLVRMLAAEAFDGLLEINLETDGDVASLFTSKDPARNRELLGARTSLADGQNQPFRLLSLPLCLVGQARRICRECLKPALFMNTHTRRRDRPASPASRPLTAPAGFQKEPCGTWLP